MELYIGGISQGKLKFVLQKNGITYSNKLICEGADCTEEDMLLKPIINQFHQFIKRLVNDNVNVEEFIEKLIMVNPSVIIICNEVGYGIVPTDKADRVYREAVGRSCCRLAEHADMVERIICGMGQRIK